MTGIPSKMVLQWAMEIETNGEAFYKAVAAQSKDREVKMLFDDLAYQEARHRTAFQRMRDRAPSADLGEADPVAYEEYLKTALRDALFGGPEKGLALAKQAADEEAAIKAAIAFEKDTLLFFYDVRDMAPESQREAITGVIEEERSHVSQLVRVLQDRPWVV